MANQLRSWDAKPRISRRSPGHRKRKMPTHVDGFVNVRCGYHRICSQPIRMSSSNQTSSHLLSIASEDSDGIDKMLEARHYANDVEVDPWQFALDLPDLLSEGLCKNQLRWLVCRGFVEHAREITKRNATARTFQPVQCL